MPQFTVSFEPLGEGPLAGPPDEVASIRQMLANRPGSAPARFALAQALERRGDTAEAIRNYERTIAIKPHCVEAHEKLAALLARLGRYEQARLHYEQAAALAPENFQIQNNLGTVLQELGAIEAAIACYERALQIAPTCLEAHVNLAAARTKRREFAAAAAGLERASELHPASVEIHNRLAQALLPLGRLHDAQRHYAAAIRLQPDKLLWRLRHDLLVPAVFASNAAIDEYQQTLAQRLAAYRGERIKFDIDELPASNCQPPVELTYQGRDDLPLRRQLAGIFADSLPSNRPDKGSGAPSLAFFVPKGSEGIFLRGMAGVLARLTPGRFRTTIVCASRGIGQFRAALADAPIEYLPRSNTLSATVETVRAQRFDLAYFWEVGTDAASYFLPFFRLAAVQCTSWGWPVTSGIGAMDYFLSSDLLEPADGESHYSEQLIRLKNIPNYYPRPTGAMPRADRERFGVTPEQHVYVCAQNPWKIQPDFDALAGEILRRDPRGILLLVEARWPHVTSAIRERFCRSFPDCAARLRFVPRMIQADYLTLLATADVALDTVHYAGGANSIYDAFAVGTPVVTLPTGLHRGRYTQAAYRTMGMTACIASTAAEYVELAVRLAGEPDRRRAVSEEIVARRQTLFDNIAAVRELAELFEQLAMQGRQAAS